MVTKHRSPNAFSFMKVPAFTVSCAVLVVLSCWDNGPVSPKHNAGVASIAPRVLCKSAATGDALPAGLHQAVAHITVGFWDTTISENFAKRRVTIGNVRVGFATVVLSFLDALGDTVYSGEQSLSLMKGERATPTIDVHPADENGMVLIVTNPSPDFVTNSSSITVSGFVSTKKGIKSLTVADVAANLQGSDFSAQIDLQEGENTVVVAAIDNEYNIIKKEITIIRDSQAKDDTSPHIVAESPAFIDDTARVGTTPVVVSGRVYDASPIQFFFINDTKQPLDGDRWSQSLSLQEGTNTITVEAHDSHGNIATRDLYIEYNRQIVDSTGPSLSVTSPQNNEVVGKAQITVRGTATDPSGIQSVNIMVGQTDTVTASRDDGGNFEATITLQPGEVDIVIVARDTKNNSSKVDLTVTYNESIVDTVKPSVRITKPADGYISLSTAITVEGTADDNGSGIKSVKVNDTEAALSGIDWSAAITLTFGNNVITAEAIDHAGQIATHKVNVVYDSTSNDTTGPTLNITSHANGQTVASTPIAIAGEVEDPSGIAELTINSIAVSPVNGNWSNFNQWSHVFGLAEGENTFQIVAKDTKGNQTVATLKIVYEASQTTNTPPDKPNTPFPLAGKTGVAVIPTFGWNGDDADGDQVFYTVFWDTVTPPTALRKIDLTQSSFRPTTMRYGTQYFWRVVAHDTKDTTTGPVWDFTTAAYPYIKPDVLVPLSDDIGDTWINARWSKSDDPGFKSYTIYMKEANATSTFSELTTIATVTDTSFQIANLMPESTYIFMVVVDNNMSLLPGTEKALTTQRALTWTPVGDINAVKTYSGSQARTLTFAVDSSQSTPKLFVGYLEGLLSNNPGYPTVLIFSEENPQWTVVGTRGFGQDYGYFANMEAARDGTLYFVSQGNGLPYAYSFKGGEWTTLRLESSIQSAHKLTFAYNYQRIPLVIGSNYLPEVAAREMLVYRYNGSVWNAGMSASGEIPTSCRSVDMALDANGIEYVVYQKSSLDLHVAQRSPSGPAQFLTTMNSFQDADKGTSSSPYASIAINSSDLLFVGYRSADSSGRAVVMRHLNTTYWDILTGSTVSQRAATQIELMTHGASLFVAFLDDNGLVHVKTMSGGVWIDVGNPLDIPADASITNIHLGKSGNNVYLAFLSGDSAPYTINVYKHSQ